MTEKSTPSTQGTTASTGTGGTASTGTGGIASTGTGGTAVAGPLTIRDLAVLGSVVLIFIASLIPLLDTRAGSLNLWNTTNLFYMGVGMILPLATAALFVIRRFSPGTKLRLGSLSLDQFASVAAVFSAFFFFASITTNFRAAFLVGIIGGVLFMLSTVCAPWIPVLAADFTGRADTPAHVVARDAATPAKRKAAPKPVVNAGTFGAPGAPAGPGFQGAASGAPGTTGAAAQGAPAAADGWVGNRPNQAHTPAGQIFTTAKDERPGAHTPAGTAAPAAPAGAAGSAPAGAAGAAGAAATSTAADPAAAAKTTPGAGSTTSGTGVSNNPAGTQEIAKDAAAATGSDAAGPSADSASSSSPAAGHIAGDKGAQAPASTTSDSSSEDLATTLNPQLSKSGQDRSATDQSAAAAAATATTFEAAAPVAPKAGDAAPAKASITATVDPKAAAPAVSTEPFWFAVDRPQNVIDEQTRQFIYKLTPGSWILALEDRGNSFLVQDSRGKTGLLLDLVGIERASDSQ